MSKKTYQDPGRFLMCELPRRTPCLSCERKDQDKDRCARTCKRLTAFINDEAWDDIPIPDLNETVNLPPVIMCKKCGEKPATLNLHGRVVNGLCGYCMNKTMREAKERKSMMEEIEKTSAKRARPGEKKVCEYPDCDRPCKARGLCSKHYDAWIRGRLSGRPEYKRIQNRRKKKKKKTVVETFPESQIAVDLSRYPYLRDLVFSTAQRLYVTPEHVIISMLGQAAARAKRSDQ